MPKRDVLKLERGTRFETREDDGEGGKKDVLQPGRVAALAGWCQIDG